MDEWRCHVELIFEYEVTRLELVIFSVRKVSEVRDRSIGRKYLVILAPDDQGWWLLVAKESLEFHIERNIGSVIQEQVELYLPVSRPVE